MPEAKPGTSTQNVEPQEPHEGGEMPDMPTKPVIETTVRHPGEEAPEEAPEEQPNTDTKPRVKGGRDYT